MNRRCINTVLTKKIMVFTHIASKTRYWKPAPVLTISLSPHKKLKEDYPYPWILRNTEDATANIYILVD
jgi:hypothetical protein